MGLVMAAAARSRWPIRWLCLAGGLDAAWRGSRGGGPRGGRHSLWGDGVPKHGVGGQHLGNRVADVYHLGHSQKKKKKSLEERATPFRRPSGPQHGLVCQCRAGGGAGRILSFEL